MKLHRVFALAGDGRSTRLLGRYLAPYWPAVALLVALSYVSMALAALLPVLMAPLRREWAMLKQKSAPNSSRTPRKKPS